MSNEIELKTDQWITRIYASILMSGFFTVCLAIILWPANPRYFLGVFLIIWCVKFPLCTLVFWPDVWIDPIRMRLCKGVFINSMRFVVRWHSVPHQITLVLRYMQPGRKRQQHGWYLGVLKTNSKYVWFEFNKDKNVALTKMKQVAKRLATGGFTVRRRVDP